MVVGQARLVSRAGMERVFEPVVLKLMRYELCFSITTASSDSPAARQKKNTVVTMALVFYLIVAVILIDSFS